MLPSYRDITTRIAEPPTFFDDNGVPRYEPFTPELLGVYDDFALLAKIACQSCGRQFLVGCGWPRFNVFQDPIIERTLANLVRGFDYGDPPRHSTPDNNRCAGETMSSDLVRIVEAWERTGLNWSRRVDWTRRVDCEGQRPR